MKKDARIDVRVTAQDKARWHAEASRVGLDLTTFLEVAVEEKVASLAAKRRLLRQRRKAA